MDRLSIDFKGPLPVSINGNRYFLTVIDEFSRFPFAIPSKDMEPRTVIKALRDIFMIFGLAGYIHSDKGRSLISHELRLYLTSLGIPCSNTTPYNHIILRAMVSVRDTMASYGKGLNWPLKLKI